MRYLRILRKKDFDERLAQELKYVTLTRELDSLESEEVECRSKLKSADSKGKEYAELVADLQKFDDKLQKVYDKYVALRDERKGLVDETQRKKSELYDKSKEDVQEHSRRLIYLRKNITALEKTIASYKNKRYSEYCDELAKRKVTRS